MAFWVQLILITLFGAQKASFYLMTVALSCNYPKISLVSNVYFVLQFFSVLTRPSFLEVCKGVGAVLHI